MYMYVDHSDNSAKSEEKIYFNGLFYSYDWSEFLVYVGGAFLIFIIKKLSDKNEEDTVTY